MGRFVRNILTAGWTLGIAGVVIAEAPVAFKTEQIILLRQPDQAPRRCKIVAVETRDGSTVYKVKALEGGQTFTIYDNGQTEPTPPVVQNSEPQPDRSGNSNLPVEAVPVSRVKTPPPPEIPAKREAMPETVKKITPPPRLLAPAADAGQSRVRTLLNKITGDTKPAQPVPIIPAVPPPPASPYGSVPRVELPMPPGTKQMTHVEPIPEKLVPVTTEPPRIEPLPIVRIPEKLTPVTAEPSRNEPLPIVRSAPKRPPIDPRMPAGSAVVALPKVVEPLPVTLAEVVPAVVIEPVKAKPVPVVLTAQQRATAVLQEAMQPSQREQAAEWLAQSANRSDARRLLLAAFHTDPAPSVRATCLRLLGQMDGTDSEVRAAVVKANSDADAEVRQEASAILTRKH